MNSSVIWSYRRAEGYIPARRVHSLFSAVGISSVDENGKNYDENDLISKTKFFWSRYTELRRPIGGKWSKKEYEDLMKMYWYSILRSSENLIFMMIRVEKNWFEDIVQLILHADSFHPSIIFDSPLKCLWHVLDLLKVVSCKVFNCQVLVCTVERERGINWAICNGKSTG